MQALSIKQQGFTIVELIVVVAVVALLTPLILGPLGNVYQANTESLGRATKESDIRGVLRQIEKDLANNKSFTDSYTTVTPLGAKSGGTWGASWSYSGMGGDNSSQRVLIAKVPATSAFASNDPSGSRYPIFVAPSGACPADPTASMAVDVTVVYYMAPASSSNAAQAPSNSNPYNLYRRTIVPALAAGTQYCYGRTPIQKTTCAASVASGVCAGAGKDALLVNDIRSFRIDYFLNQDTATTIPGQYASSSNRVTEGGVTYAAPANPITDAKAVKITAATGQVIDGARQTIEASIRISRTY